MNPVLVGIAPARDGEQGQPLSCIAARSTGGRLKKVMGLTRNQYLTGFDRVNVCPHPMPSTVKASEFKDHVENLTGSLLRCRTVIFMGPNVAECFGIRRNFYDFCEWRHRPHNLYGLAGWRVGSTPPFTWAVVPHPSGRNHWWNDADNTARARRFLLSAYQGDLIDA